MSFEGGIWATKMGFGLQGWDLGLKAGIRASRLRFGPQDWDLSLVAKVWILW